MGQPVSWGGASSPRPGVPGRSLRNVASSGCQPHNLKYQLGSAVVVIQWHVSRWATDLIKCQAFDCLGNSGSSHRTTVLGQHAEAG